jgi:hypothetical protein
MQLPICSQPTIYYLPNLSVGSVYIAVAGHAVGHCVAVFRSRLDQSILQYGRMGRLVDICEVLSYMIEKLIWLPQGFLRRTVHLCTSCWCVKFTEWILNCSALELAIGIPLAP